MTTTYEVMARLEALEMGAGMNTAQVERLLATLDRICLHLSEAVVHLERIDNRLGDITDIMGEIGQEGEPDA